MQVVYFGQECHKALCFAAHAQVARAAVGPPAGHTAFDGLSEGCVRQASSLQISFLFVINVLEIL